MPPSRCNRNSGVLVAILVALGLLGTVVLGMWSAGIWINTTPSFPIGLYQETGPGSNADTGDLVVFCLPRERWLREPPWSWRCPDRAQPILKQAAALPGTKVAIDAGGIWVDGRPVPNSRPLPRLESIATSGRVPAGMFWALSDHSPDSYDSRYFGPLPLPAIRAVVRPLLFQRVFN